MKRTRNPLSDVVVTLKLEAIGDDSEGAMASFARTERALGIGPRRARGCRRPWVAEIIGTHDHYGLARVFLDGQKDYSEANSVGSRGVYLYFHLRPGRIYEVHELQSWSRSRTYFAVVHEGALTEVSRAQVVETMEDMDGARV